MKKVFVANPARKRKRATRKAQKKTSRINPLPLVIGNPFRRSSTMAKSKKRKNAGAGASRPRHRESKPFRRHRRANRNPFSAGGEGVVKLIFGSAAGLLASVYIPSVVLSALGKPDSGMFSYALAIAATLVPASLLKSMPDVAKGWLAGGSSGVVWRAIDDVTGSNVLTVQSGGMGSFFTKPVRVPLPAGNVFSTYGRPGGPGNMLACGTSAEGGPAPYAGGAAPAAIAASSKASGMKWVQM